MCVTGDQHKSVSPCQEKENGEEDNEVEEDEEDVGDEEEEEDREGRFFLCHAEQRGDETEQQQNMSINIMQR